MISVLYLCGIIFAICVYRGSQIRYTEGQFTIYSVSASAAFRPFFTNPIILMPASADDHICIPFLRIIFGRRVRDRRVFLTALNSLTHGLSGQMPGMTGIVDHSLSLYKYRRKC